MGFPSRIIRTTLGPELRDVYPVTNPETDIGAGTFNAAFHQLVGCNLTVPLIHLYADIDDGVITTIRQALAWDTKGVIGALTWVRNGPGDYTLTLPQATYEDENGNPVEVTLTNGAQVIPQGRSGTSLVLGVAEATASRTLRVYLQTAAGASVDVDFILRAW